MRRFSIDENICMYSARSWPPETPHRRYPLNINRYKASRGPFERKRSRGRTHAKESLQIVDNEVRANRWALRKVADFFFVQLNIWDFATIKLFYIYI